MTEGWILQTKDNLGKKSLNEKEPERPVEEQQRRGMGAEGNAQEVGRGQDPRALGSRQNRGVGNSPAVRCH